MVVKKRNSISVLTAKSCANDIFNFPEELQKLVKQEHVVVSPKVLQSSVFFFAEHPRETIEYPSCTTER